MAAQMPYLVTVEGHALSIHNACLVALQLPSATILGGYRQWQAAGRQVRKGEHGLMIWAPRMKKDADTGDEERAGFIPINLFDVSQTDAADITAAA
jgi:antirestriction protein ArdC